MLITFTLMCMSWIDLGMVVTYKDEQGLFDVQIVTAIFNALAYVSFRRLQYLQQFHNILSSVLRLS